MSAAMQSISNAVKSSRMDKVLVFGLLVFLLIVYIWVLRTDQIYSLMLLIAGGFLGLLKGNTEK
jgi:hypothetical protein